MMKTVTLHPSRIGCPSIPGTMKGMVHSISGVQDVRVRYEDRSLDVTFDDAKTSVEEIIKRIGEEMGLALEMADTHGASKEGNVAETCPM
jgi:copper chaperone CopZ